MGRRMRLEPHLAVDATERSYRAAKEPHERSWWQILWLLAKGQTATAAAVAESTGYPRYWIGQLVRRYNEQGPAAMHNGQAQDAHRPRLLLSAEHLAELAEAVRGPAPEGEYWLGRSVAAWMSHKLGRPISVYLGWASLVRLDGKRRTPRPRHVLADPEQQAACKKTSAHSSRRLRPPSPTPRSSSGPSMSIGSA